MSRAITLTIAFALFAVLTVGAAETSSCGTVQAQTTSEPQKVAPSLADKPVPANDSGQQQATKEDLQKMRVILNQMRTNLAFVGNSTTPLNHQFELDIEMWQMLIDQMERRVATREHPAR
jgi:hypothetical protein